MFFERGYYTIISKNLEEYLYTKKEIKNYNLLIVYEIPEIFILQIYGDKKNVLQFYHDTKFLISESQSIVNLNTLSSNQESMPHSKKIQWDIKKITRNYKTHSMCTGSHEYCVALIDSGIDINHPDLKDNILSKVNMVPKNGFRGQEEDENGHPDYMIDKLNHGTQVAGQICGKGNITSVAPNLGIRVYRIFGGKSADNVWIMKAIIKAANDGVDVINLSLGSYIIREPHKKNGEYLPNRNLEIQGFQKAIDYAEQKGVIVVGALGNDNINIDNREEFLNYIVEKDKITEFSPSSTILDLPSQLNNVIGVASANANNQLASYSNYSENNIDILAYAGDTTLLDKYGKDYWLNNQLIMDDWVLTTSQEGSHIFSTGNSLASGKVAASIAVMNQYFNINKNPELTRHILGKQDSSILNLYDLLHTKF
ncbi:MULTISPECIES: S8 family peptidase [Mammaliicoccus]|uniref:S8 family peptidase n=1 Tax=Mammaliicoccus TaxID=2803850 RepID=UPI001EFB649A|nr:S8 family serine peptidase [Mammaliicoccus sp. J-M41]